MIISDDFEDFLKLLNKYQVAYLVVGGYAMAFHGKPRYTGDLDVWIDISEDNSVKMVSVINDFGFGSLGFSAKDFSKPNLVNQIGYPPLRIDILTSIDGVTFEEAYSQKLELDLDENFKIVYIGLDELIKNKKSSGRKIDIVDVSDLEKKHKRP